MPGLDAPIQVLWKCEGTKLHLTSHTLDENTLLDLATSMQPVA